MICESFSRVNLEITNENKSPINNVIISSGHYSLIRCTHTYIYLIFSMYSIEIRLSALTRQIHIRVSYTYMCVIHEVL